VRTTLTLDDDVAVQIERLRRRRNASLKEIVNETLRRGLRDAELPRKTRKPFRTRAIDAGDPLLPNVDNVSEVLALLDGEGFK
jgi:hypothetical protein